MSPRSALGFSVMVLVSCAVGLPTASPPPPVVVRGAAAPLPRAEPMLHVDFENDPIGPYSPARLAADWGSGVAGARGVWSQGLSEGRASIVATERGHSLRVLYPKGSVGPSEGGAQFLVGIPGSHDDLYCSYQVRFASGFGFVRGGKLPGLVGGSHPTGGKPADDGFSARLMWRPGGAAVQYVYCPRQTTQYGVDLPYVLPSGAPVKFLPGTWHRVEHRVAMNGTPPATTEGEIGQVHGNGILQAWFDGQPVLDLRDRVWRLDGAIHVDALYFSTFFGGNDPSWGAERDETVDFDDVVVSASPIGR